MEERRSEPRLRLRRRVDITLSNGMVVEVWSREISKRGVQVMCEYSADVGDRFTLSMAVLDPTTDQYIDVSIRAEVVHVIYDGADRAFRIGFKFIEFAPGTERVFDRYVDAQLNTHHLLRS